MSGVDEVDEIDRIIAEQEADSGDDDNGDDNEAGDATAGDGDANKTGDGDTDGNADDGDDDPEIAAMREKMRAIEEENEKIKELQEQVKTQLKESGSNSLKSSAGGAAAQVKKEDADARSVYVGQVDFSATPEELQEHFQASGAILRITIMCDKFTGRPKGFAYIEFADEASAENALVLNETIFKGRQLKVTKKRTNVPSWQLRGRGRGRGFRGRGRYRGRGRGRGYSAY